MKVFTRTLLFFLSIIVTSQSASSLGICDRLLFSLSPHKQNVHQIMNEIKALKNAEVEAKFKLSKAEYDRLEQIILENKLYIKNTFSKNYISYESEFTIYNNSYLNVSSPSLNISMRKEPNNLLLIFKESPSSVRLSKLPIFIREVTIEKVDVSLLDENINPTLFTAKTYRTNLKLKSKYEQDQSSLLYPIQILLDKTLYYQGDQFIGTGYELEVEMPLYKSTKQLESYRLKLIEFLKLVSSLKQTFKLKNQTLTKFEKGLELIGQKP